MRHVLRESEPAQEVAQIVGQDEQGEADSVGGEPGAREPRPGEGELALLYPLFACAPPVVKMNDGFR